MCSFVEISGNDKCSWNCVKIFSIFSGEKHIVNVWYTKDMIVTDGFAIVIQSVSPLCARGYQFFGFDKGLF